VIIIVNIYNRDRTGMTGVVLYLYFLPKTSLYNMSLSDTMDTREVRSVMTEMENGLSKEGVCLQPKFDLKYMFTVHSKVDNPETKVSYFLESFLVVD
jgi:hypothetical protein